MISTLLNPRNSTMYGIGITNTFRLNSKAILKNNRTGFPGWGTNLQNIEKMARAIYKPDLQKKFLQADQSGAEALVVAYLAKPGKFRDLFKFNVKPHVYVALHLFKKEWQIVNPALDFDLAVTLEPAVLTSHPDWRLIDKLIKSSDDWPAERRYYYMAKQTCHCVDGETEVLTLTGWKLVSEVKDDEAIATWDKDWSIKFEVPVKWNRYDYEGEMIHFSNDTFDQLVTPNHKMMTWSNDKFTVIEASDMDKFKESRLPICGDYVGGPVNVPDNTVKLLAAVQADGYIDGKSVRFGFRVEHKIKRIKMLLAEADVEYRHSIDSEKTHRFYIPSLPKVTDWFKDDGKRFGAYLLTWSKKSILTLIDELKEWDGDSVESYCHKRTEFRSSILSNVEWIRLLTHFTKRQSKIYQSGKGLRVTYKASLNNRTMSRLPRKHISKVDYKGIVYCPTTSTGCFMIRRASKVSVCMNSANYGIRGPTFQLNTLKKSEGKIALTRQQADYFLSFYRAMFPEIVAWNNETRDIVRATSVLRNLFGHPRQFTGDPNNSSFDQEAYAFVPQSTVAEITHRAYRDLQNYIEVNLKSWDLLANTHDSYLVQCLIEEELECAKMMKIFMEQELTGRDGVKFRMKSEVQSGFNWAPWKEKYNEKGLREVKGI